MSSLESYGGDISLPLHIEYGYRIYGYYYRVMQMTESLFFFMNYNK